jgi:hypothetical protein
MPQPVKISDALLLEARIAGETMNRSMAGQIEFWAQLGRSIERLMNGKDIHRLRADSPPPQLSEVLASVNTPAGRVRLQAVLDAEPFPHFRPVPGKHRLFERIDEDGTKTIGRVIDREFVPVEPAVA